MTFRGWPEEALDFFEGLERDNSRAYWTAHKAVYEECVLGPMTALTDELAAEFGEPRIFRPYRDVRFSADKSPYRTDIGATVGSGYIRLSAAGLAAGNGMYLLAPDQLDRYRRAVAADRSGAELDQITTALAARSAGGISLTGHDMLRTAPRGYPPDHPRIGLLRYKGLVAWHEWAVERWLGTTAAKDHVREFLVATAPLADWLDAHVGPSELPDGRPR
ncbi:MAG TPA: DUF2461 domain-containing protein [Streptosporangiaceae bacterium]|nr:DUF2461 domain-containing protein [Streptosporangiaceae bacterium]